LPARCRRPATAPAPFRRPGGGGGERLFMGRTEPGGSRLRSTHCRRSIPTPKPAAFECTSVACCDAAAKTPGLSATQPVCTTLVCFLHHNVTMACLSFVPCAREYCPLVSTRVRERGVRSQAWVERISLVIFDSDGVDQRRRTDGKISICRDVRGADLSAYCTDGAD
jgi:hypothetical protein